MNNPQTESPERCIIDVDGFAIILNNLIAKGYSLAGPTVEDNAIVYERIDSIKNLPQGWMDEQGPGYYRIRKTDNPFYFNFTVGPHSWKKYLHPPRQRLWMAERQGKGFKLSNEDTHHPSHAFIGVRPCEIKAIQIQERVFRGDHYTDTHFDQTRKKAFILAINCSRANDTCFCSSMNSGPTANDGYDMALTEFMDEDRHLFLVDIGSDKGAEVLDKVIIEEALPEHLNICLRQQRSTVGQMTRRMDTENIRETLLANPDHPRWKEVAERCLTCANCTMACPTCFCTTVEDTTDLTGNHAERWQRWDSCFTMDFSYVAGGSIRSSAKSRYRQWLTHKLATWHDQFGTTGCVGCGRCITWCPVGIDITEEVAAIQNSPITR